jgi:hypothetical protein
MMSHTTPVQFKFSFLKFQVASMAVQAKMSDAYKILDSKMHWMLA